MYTWSGCYYSEEKMCHCGFNVMCWIDTDNSDSSRTAVTESSRRNSPTPVSSSASLCGISQTAFKPVTPRRSASVNPLMTTKPQSNGPLYSKTMQQKPDVSKSVVIKSMKQTTFWRCFLTEDTFNEESDSGITDSCSGCGRPHSAHPTAKINRVKDLALIFWSVFLTPPKR